MSLSTNLRDAEYHARIRDEKAQNGGLTDSELAEKQSMVAELVNEIEAKTGKTVAIFQNKKHSKVKFAQIIQENMRYLIQNKILSTAEKAFLMDISFLIGFKSNGLVKIVDNVQMAMTQEEIATETGRTRSKVNGLINGLIDKGIMAKLETSLEGNNARAYVVYVNPNVIYNGDKNEIEEGLRLNFRKANKNKYLKDLPIKLYK